MDYKKIKSYSFSEEELRRIWEIEYCSVPIFTFDGIHVKFYASTFNHTFYESADRKARDKTILSLNRLEKIYWIKSTLLDSKAVLKAGWDRDKKKHDHKRRVAIVKGNYVVVIQIYGVNKANFITAYQIDDEKNLELFMNGPDWKKNTAD